jgi:hypothetical protein
VPSHELELPPSAPQAPPVDPAQLQHVLQALMPAGADPAQLETLKGISLYDLLGQIQAAQPSTSSHAQVPQLHVPAPVRTQPPATYSGAVAGSSRQLTDPPLDSSHHAAASLPPKEARAYFSPPAPAPAPSSVPAVAPDAPAPAQPAPAPAATSAPATAPAPATTVGDEYADEPVDGPMEMG